MHKLSIEKNGTGMKCSENMIEKNGTGMSLIEKNGTGVSFIEKNGTGIRRIGFICCLFLFFGLMNVAMASQWDAHIVKQGDSVAISLNNGEQQLLGVGVQKGGYLIVPVHVKSEGNGTGFTKSEGNGTGFNTRSEGNGTGYHTRSEGNGTGYNTRSEGNGTGYHTRSEGNGTGYHTRSEGNGTGSYTRSEGNGTGYHTRSEGNGTGAPKSEGNGTGAPKSEGNGTGHKLMTVFGYAEIALNGDTASVLIYKDNARGGMIELAALELPVFEQ